MIKEPMDFATIRSNLPRYKTKQQFEADVMKIFLNAKEYNKEDTVYYKAAVDMEKDVGSYLAILNDDSLLNEAKTKLVGDQRKSQKKRT